MGCCGCRRSSPLNVHFFRLPAMQSQPLCKKLCLSSESSALRGTTIYCSSICRHCLPAVALACRCRCQQGATKFHNSAFRLGGACI